MRRQARISLAPLLLAFGACAEREPSGPLSPLVDELARMSFVPGDPEEKRPPLLVDRYETTNQEYLRFLREGKYQADGPAFLLHWKEEGSARIPPVELEEHPVVFVSRSDAEAYASWKNKRLPAVSEWERIACARSAASFLPRTPPVQYAWGSAWFPLFCNTFELGLGKTTAVGTFESGKSLYGCYDVAGNVWEWAVADEDPARGVLKGGAFDFGKDKTQCYEALESDPRQRAHDVGFRCVAEFESFLSSRLKGFRPRPADSRVLSSLARQWGPAAEAALSRLAEREGLDRKLLGELREATRERP